jgi:RNA polymerase sigma-70 factor (ECF subfamily)
VRPEDWDWTSARGRCLAEARRILHSQTAAEEAVQEAFLRAWRRRASCRNPAAPLPWLLQITRNEALRLRSRSIMRGELPTEDPMTDAEPDPMLEQTINRLDVQRALAELTDEERILIAMRYDDDLTQPRIAELLDIPEGTVKVRLHRLRQRLRLALDIDTQDR